MSGAPSASRIRARVGFTSRYSRQWARFCAAARNGRRCWTMSAYMSRGMWPKRLPRKSSSSSCSPQGSATSGGASTGDVAAAAAAAAFGPPRLRSGRFRGVPASERAVDAAVALGGSGWKYRNAARSLMRRAMPVGICPTCPGRRSSRVRRSATAMRVRTNSSTSSIPALVAITRTSASHASPRPKKDSALDDDVPTSTTPVTTGADVEPRRPGDAPALLFGGATARVTAPDVAMFLSGTGALPGATATDDSPKCVRLVSPVVSSAVT
mmetsp:Transcript_28829/g.89262  ORF Transcript_28829/g.89262 Transcript_28829/m.89262 type:complete len:268 (-) Transcript_28829:8-811(-)